MVDTKKHRQHMTPDELDRITARLRELTFTATTHLSRQMRMWSLKNLPHPAKCNIVEFNTNAGDRRVLLRHTTGVWYVASLRTGNLMTAYFNDPNDNHPTLERDQYTRSLKVEW